MTEQQGPFCARCGRDVPEPLKRGVFRLCAACAGWIDYLRQQRGMRWGWSGEVTGQREDDRRGVTDDAV